MNVVTVLCETGFDRSLGYMAYGRSQDVDWWRCSSNLIPYSLELVEVSDASLRNASSSRFLNTSVISDHIVPASFIFYVLEDLTSVPTIQTRFRFPSEANRTSSIRGLRW